MGVIPNPKMAFIFPISCILALIFPILIKYFPKCVGKGSFPKSQIKSLEWLTTYQIGTNKHTLKSDHYQPCLKVNSMNIMTAPYLASS